jgi:hypothetical protein
MRSSPPGERATSSISVSYRPVPSSGTTPHDGVTSLLLAGVSVLSTLREQKRCLAATDSESNI